MTIAEYDKKIKNDYEEHIILINIVLEQVIPKRK